MTLQALKQVPDASGGYELEGYDLSFLRAREATNVVANPSLETATTGWSANAGAALARTTAQQRRGVYSLQVTPTASVLDGVLYTSVSLAAGFTYFLSFDFKGEAGYQYFARIGSEGGKTWKATGQWQRISLARHITSTTTYTILIVKNSHANVRPFYVDGVQVERDRLTTYLDGSLTGFFSNQQAYYWTGTAHASTSVRTAATRHGGEEVKLKDLGFTLLALVGLGLSGYQNVIEPNAVLGGGHYQNTVKVESTFDLVGTIQATHDDRMEVRRKRKALTTLVSPLAANVKQPLMLRVRMVDDCGEPVADAVDVPCLYAGGLEGNRAGFFQEPLTITFTTFLPYVARMDGSSGATLSHESPFTAAYGARRIDGTWGAISTGFDADVYAMAVDEVRGRVYFGGIFTLAGGVTVNEITYWDGAQFVAMGGATKGVAGGEVYDIAIAPNGDVWVCGRFTSAGGAATDSVARWNTATNTWTVFTNGTAGDEIYALAIDSSGNVYGAGSFTNWDGIAAADYIWKYNGTVFSALGTSPFSASNLITGRQGMAFDADGNLWTGEQTPAAPNIAYLRKWNGTTWTTVLATNSQVGATIYALHFDAAGNLYIGGGFQTLGGVSASNVALYNGTSVTPLGVGADNGVFNFLETPDGLLVSGTFASVGGLSNTDSFAFWTGSTWNYVDVDLPGAAVPYGTGMLNGNLYVGHTNSGTATASGVTTVDNPGSADAYPIISITGPGTVIALRNLTTGDYIDFVLTLNAGETAVLDLSPGGISFSSNFRPNLLNTINPGSSLATFRLVPGENEIGLFITGDTAATLGLLEYTPVYECLDDALYP